MTLSPEPPADSSPAPLPADASAAALPRSAGRSDALRIALAFVVALALCIVAYLAFVVPGSWFPSASTQGFGVREMTLTRGSGRVVADELVVTAADAAGTTLISLRTDLRSTDYPTIAWIVADVPEGVGAFLLWQSDYAPGKVNRAPIAVESGRLVPLTMTGQEGWIGRIKGLALVLQGPLAQPVRVRGVVAKTMGAGEILGDRVREWLAFEGWNGASINTLTGGADVQDLPLPALVAATIVLASLLVLAWLRWRPDALAMRWPAAVGALFVIGWLVVDLRWSANLARQETATIAQFGGKDWREKRMANEDAIVFDFVQKALAVIGKPPQRIFVAADAHYFRGRAAYELYPNDVFFHPRLNMIPAAALMKPGDWLFVFQRRGVQYDPSQQRLRWDDGQTIAAEQKLTGPGAALFLIK